MLHYTAQGAYALLAANEVLHHRWASFGKFSGLGHTPHGYSREMTRKAWRSMDDDDLSLSPSLCQMPRVILKSFVVSMPTVRRGLAMLQIQPISWESHEVFRHSSFILQLLSRACFCFTRLASKY